VQIAHDGIRLDPLRVDGAAEVGDRLPAASLLRGDDAKEEVAHVAGGIGRHAAADAATSGPLEEDIGHRLHVLDLVLGRHLKELRRTKIGNFNVADAIHYDRLSQAGTDVLLAPPHFQSLSDIDLPLEKLRIDWAQQGKMMQGQGVIMVPAVPVRKGDLLALGNPHDQLVAIGEVVNVLREGGPVEVRPKVVLAG